MNYTGIDTTNYKRLMNEYHIHSLLAKVICSFDYTDTEIASFFSPLKTLSFDEKIFSPIKAFLQKIKEENQKVFIFGDYDCDGICASAIIKKVLDKLGIESGFYIPDRQKEGYGLNLNRLAQAYEKGYRVLITVDNGVSALEPLKWAKEHNMRVLVTDHHIITEQFETDYLLHPSLFEKDYSYLCGAGVVYLLAEYLGLSDDSIKVLAMVATISDVMSLKGANIKIVRDGLAILNHQGYANINLLDNFNLPITEEDISFRIAPKLNAIGRMTSIVDVKSFYPVKYLLNDNIGIIRREVEFIKEINNKRQELSNQQYELVKTLLEENASCNIVYCQELYEGLVGLIASKLAAQSNKITFIFTASDTPGLIKGSGRGIKGVNLVELLEDFKSNFVHFGGHSQACGITMELEKLEQFKHYITTRLANEEIHCDEKVLDIDLNELNYHALRELFDYRPFGEERKIPFVRTTIENFSDFRMLKNENQLRWSLPEVSFISFSNNKGYQYYMNKQSIRIVGELKENCYKGRVSYQVMIKEFLD